MRGPEYVSVQVALGGVAEHLLVGAPAVRGDRGSMDKRLSPQTDLGRGRGHGVEAAGDGQLDRLVEQFAEFLERHYASPPVLAARAPPPAAGLVISASGPDPVSVTLIVSTSSGPPPSGSHVTRARPCCASSAPLRS